ncbi:putative transporter [Zalerion maritima]|uniref:Transporter n=1 Tax=Zalerion maritima TaxID=339359 RepID=A0AAD5WV42_9PEZI|nr:putative transporter [Zalerion maritima]
MADSEMKHVQTTDSVATEKSLSHNEADEFGAHTKTDQKETAVVKKLDMHILPTLWLMCSLNFPDRNPMINGKLNGLAEDLNLRGTQHSTCVSILFVRIAEAPGLRGACADWRTWLFCLMDSLHISADAFNDFLLTVVKTGNFNTTVDLPLACPSYFMAGITSIIVSYSSGRFNERLWHVTISKGIAIASFAMSAATLSVVVCYAGVMLFADETYGVNDIILGWTPSTLGRTDEEKAVAIAM